MFKRICSLFICLGIIFPSTIHMALADSSSNTLTNVSDGVRLVKKGTNAYLVDLGRAYPIEYVDLNTTSTAEVYVANDPNLGASFTPTEALTNVALGKHIKSATYGGGGFLKNIATCANDGDSSTAYVSTPVSYTDTDSLTIDLDDFYEVEYVSITSNNVRPQTVYLSEDDAFTNPMSTTNSDGKYIPSTKGAFRYARVVFEAGEDSTKNHFSVSEIGVYANIINTVTVPPITTKLEYSDGHYVLPSSDLPQNYRYIYTKGVALSKLATYVRSEALLYTNRVNTSNITTCPGAVVYGTLGPANAGDGDEGTICAFNGTNPYLQVDLGEAMFIGHVEARVRRDTADDRSDIKILASNDVDFKDSYEIGAQATGEELRIKAQLVRVNNNPLTAFRYVRVYEGASKSFMVMADVGVYAKPADASYEEVLNGVKPTTTDNANLVYRVNDNDDKTYWQGGAVSFGLGRSRAIKRLRMYGEGEFTLSIGDNDTRNITLIKGIPYYLDTNIKASTIGLELTDGAKLCNIQAYAPCPFDNATLDAQSGSTSLNTDQYASVGGRTAIIAKYDKYNRLCGVSMAPAEDGLIQDDGEEYQTAKLIVLDDTTSLRPATPTGGVDVVNKLPYKQYYVSLSGSDNNDGSINSPFATITRARDAVCAISSQMDSDIIVHIGAGVYNIDEEIAFTSADSGFNGYYVRYVGEDGAELTGTRVVTGFSEGSDGLLQVYLPNEDSVYDLVVNGTKATLAHTEVSIKPSGTFNKGYGYSNDGFKFNAVDLPLLSNPEDVYIHTCKSWIDVFLRATDARLSNGQVYLEMLQPYFNRATTSSSMSTFGIGTSDYYDISNAYELLDTPGEFYFNKNTHILYYMPRAGENTSNITAEIPCIDRLLSVKGDAVGKHIHNVVFDNIKLSNTTDSARYRWGVVTDQAQMVRMGAYEKKMVGGAIEIDYATDITFTNCEFTNLTRSAISMGEGAIDCSIDNNSFHDLGDGAVVVGRKWHNEINKSSYTNKQYDCFTRTPLWTSSGDANQILLNKENNLLLEQTYYVWSSDSTDINKGVKPWVEIDLLKPYTISQIELYFKSYQKNFEVLVSNDINFNTYTTVATVGNTSKYSYTAPNTDTTKYRYVKIQKTALEAFKISNIYVRTSDVPYTNQIEELCEGNSITNNYIENTALTYRASPSITVFHTYGTAIENNSIINSNYSAISMGWGWEYEKDCKNSANNHISGNYISNINLTAADGGGVYIMANQTGTIVENNFIEQTVMPSQAYTTVGIYAESGLANATIRNNVIDYKLLKDRASAYPLAFFMKTGDKCVVHDNYGTYTTVFDGGTDYVLERLIKYSTPTVEVGAIIDNAGCNLK